jgi:CubicO group peptidase (beta-lactamase class C family)/predicted glycoside hydrolase/deacetylase ChbG (UPF0249 family)
MIRFTRATSQPNLRLHIIAAVLIIFLTLSAQAQKSVSLPRSSPESQGVSSEQILKLVEEMEKSGHEFHSFMVVRHGKVVAEGWWNPYAANLKHTMYSVSKSFTATAVGFAVAEKKLTVEDKVVSFFPNDVPANVNANLAKLRVKDLLSMTAGQAPDPTFKVIRTDNWPKAFLNTPVLHEPGTEFLYNSAATYMLSAIVQKVTGEKVIDYLKPRLFNPLGIQNIDWEVDPQGVNVGGWGLRLKTEDMAKFGQLFLKKGSWNGKQILPVSWVEEATSMKIEQEPQARQSKKDSSDWLQGYCYQMWRSRHNSYRGDGAYGQFIIVLPEQDAVVAITAQTQDMQSEFNILWEHLVPAFKEGKLPANKKAEELLKKKLSSLALPTASTGDSELESNVSGKSYSLLTNRKLQQLKMDFKDGVCHLFLDTDSVDHDLYFGKGKWYPAETTKYGPYLVAAANANRKGLPPFKVMGNYAWIDKDTLELTLRYVESPHTEKIRCVFEGKDEVKVDFENFFNKSRKRRTYTGVVKPQVSNPPRLIIRGDDMGFSHSANLALMRSYQEGIETSIEVIVPSPWFPEAVKMLQANQSVDVGLHFAITSEWDNVKWRPVTEVPSLENQDGYFFPMIYPNKNSPKQSVMENAWKVEDLEKELRAQIEMARKYIPRLSHVSGHMNSTAFTPEVREMCNRVANEYNLTMVDGGWQKDSQIANTGFDFDNKTTEERINGFIAMLDKLENGKTYVYVEHPGTDDPELRAIYHIGYEDVASGRQDVTTIWTDERVKEALLRKGIQLVSYKDMIGQSE